MPASPTTARESGHIWIADRGKRAQVQARHGVCYPPRANPIPEAADSQRRAEGDHVATILIVEDSPDNMKLFRTLLTLHGHDVLGMAGGDGLIQQILESRPDLVLMDIQLPERDGFELLQDIRREIPTALPVVALTAHAMAGDRERAMEAGFDGHITKPIDIRAFPGQVTEALRQEPPIP
ncbi:MAG: response regulator [Gemmatimonadales bacterium]|nr:MAG: response regulator [Gemmatimonadales bacterium]